MLSALCAVGVFAGCIADVQKSPEIKEEIEFHNETDNVVMNNNSIGDIPEPAYDEPFSSYTYDFSAYDSKYMITVTPNEIGTGLTLSVEDNSFGFSAFNVEPPAGYIVGLPYSQQYASQVCTVIRSGENNVEVPDLLKIDFYLSAAVDDTMPYTVSRMYSILNGKLVEVEVYDTEDTALADAEIAEDAGRGRKSAKSSSLERLDYIPDSYLYQPEQLIFMPEPEVIQHEDGTLEPRIVTYTLNPHDMTMRRKVEECSLDKNPLYYGYAVHAAAGSIYRYFTVTSLNVTDFSSYVKVETPDSRDGNDVQYFFKVDDARFHTVQDLRDYVSRYFSEDIVDEMFRSAPQQYRDIDGELYTISGDGGFDDTLGKLTITDWTVNDDIITYHTQQEKFNENYELTGYVDGGDFVVRASGDGSEFTVLKYRYPSI